ncbi:MAG: hypothetical protein QFC55_06250 [Chloroflexota bacterium]|nr:hypothetical protein [Chloroflexota bacterium]
MSKIWQGLVLGIAFIGDKLRRLPGAGLVERFPGLVFALLFIGALLAGAVWASQKSPQRISLAELAVGGLAPMQTWIIVTGDVAAGSSTASHQYVLTDPAVLHARMIINSDVELPVGRTTVSGRLIGGDARAPQGYDWVGHLQADPVAVQEQDPPWITIVLLACGLLVIVIARTHYPVFFGDAHKRLAPSRARMDVGVRRGWSPSDAVVPGTLTTEPGQRVRLETSDGEMRELRLQSASSSIEVGRFQAATSHELVLRLVASGGDLTLTFATVHDRDVACGALAAAAALRLRPQ